MPPIKAVQTADGTYDFYVNGVKVKTNLTMEEVMEEIRKLEGEKNG